MEPKLRIIRKKKSEAENAHLDPLMRALKALHSAGAPESMTAEELERQRRSQEVLGKLTAPMTGMDYEEFALSGMSAAWTRLKAPHGSRHAILYCHGGGYTSGNLGYSRVLSSKLAHATGYDVLSFEYRLAPEFPYPAAVEDALRAWDYLMLQGYGARDIVLAGDSAGVRGADAAIASGEAVALDICRELGALTLETRDRLAKAALFRLYRCDAMQPFMETFFAPSPSALLPADDAVVCRCEELTAGELRRTIEAGCYSPDGLKSQARPGMGTCQGRMCSAAVAEMIAHAHGLPIETLPPYHAQPPLFPLPLEELASMSIPPEGL